MNKFNFFIIFLVFVMFFIVVPNVRGISQSEISYNNLQFTIAVEMILFIVFMWIGYTIPPMEGKKTKFHSMPFSGGLFIIFGSISFISMSIHLKTFASGYLSGMLITIGLVILIYGVFKGFRY